MLHRGGCYVIDFQDARLGPDTYDLVSLLRDSYVDLTDRELEELIAYFLALNGNADPAEFRRRFDLMALQRNLKALGTFGFQTTTRGNPVYIQYIPRTLRYARTNLEKYERFARLREILASTSKSCGSRLGERRGRRARRSFHSGLCEPACTRSPPLGRMSSSTCAGKARLRDIDAPVTTITGSSASISWRSARTGSSASSCSRRGRISITTIRRRSLTCSSGSPRRGSSCTACTRPLVRASRADAGGRCCRWRAPTRTLARGRWRSRIGAADRAADSVRRADRASGGSAPAGVAVRQQPRRRAAQHRGAVLPGRAARRASRRGGHSERAVARRIAGALHRGGARRRPTSASAWTSATRTWTAI